MNYTKSEKEVFMSVQAISNANTPQKQRPIKKHFNTVEITGYGALGTGIASGIAGAKKKSNCTDI